MASPGNYGNRRRVKSPQCSNEPFIVSSEQECTGTYKSRKRSNAISAVKTSISPMTWTGEIKTQMKSDSNMYLCKRPRDSYVVFSLLNIPSACPFCSPLFSCCCPVPFVLKLTQDALYSFKILGERSYIFMLHVFEESQLSVRPFGKKFGLEGPMKFLDGNLRPHPAVPCWTEKDRYNSKESLNRLYFTPKNSIVGSKFHHFRCFSQQAFNKSIRISTGVINNI